MPHTDSGTRLSSALARMDVLINWERDRSERIRRNLEPVGDLLGRLGDPHRGPGAPRWVHVTGTKGKGSVVALVAEGLRRAGLRVGAYGSPHVESVNERVRVDGRDVEDDVLAQAIERVLDARAGAVQAGTPGSESTWFDTLTAAAFVVFGDARLDWVVCEVGLGGRLDSTNVIRPEVCVVTGVDLEHTHVLGGTHEAIATEKAGILKAGATFVSGLSPTGAGGEGRAAAVFLARAAELALDVRFPEPVLAEGFSARNRALAAAVLEALGERGQVGHDGRRLGAALLDAHALRAAALPGRLERFTLAGVPVYLDGAHVPSSVALACAELRALPELTGLTGPAVAVLSLATDKDAPGILKALRGCADRVVCTTVGTGRHLAAEALSELAVKAGFTTCVEPQPEQAVRRAVELASPGWVLATGSLYLAGAVRAALRRASEC